MGEAFAIFAIYMLPWLIVLCIGGFIFETIIPAIRRKRARRARHEFNRQIHR